MTPEQYCLGCCDSQKVWEDGRWDKHSSSDLHDQQMKGQDQLKGDIKCKKPSRKGDQETGEREDDCSLHHLGKPL